MSNVRIRHYISTPSINGCRVVAQPQITYYRYRVGDIKRYEPKKLVHLESSPAISTPWLHLGGFYTSCLHYPKCQEAAMLHCDLLSQWRCGRQDRAGFLCGGT